MKGKTMQNLLTTNCKSLNWIIDRAAEYTSDDSHITYRFRGNIPSRMCHEIKDWMKAQNARYNDGQSRSGYGLTIEDIADIENRWYHSTTLNLSWGCYHSTANNVEMFLSIYDCSLTDEDIADLQKGA